MAKFLYRIFLFLMRMGLPLAALINKKAQRFVEGRKNIWKQVAEVNPEHKPLLWIHCASLGEFEQGRPVIEKLRTRFPQHKVLLSFFSPSGYDVHREYALADSVLYLPVDGKGNARKWVNKLKPSFAIFVKYEFWHYYIATLKEQDIPIISISSIFRKDQIFFRRYGRFQQQILRNINHFFVQEYNSKSLLNSIGIHRVTVAGDSRFDRVYDISQQKKGLPEIEKFLDGRPVFVVGSAWHADMEIMSTFINEHDLKYIVAPHEITNHFMTEIESDIEKKCIRYSQWSQLPTGNSENFDVLIIDNIGMLSSIYRYGQFAWVGGAYGAGLHNIIEAAVYGLPVFFGNKNYSKFREARDLINLGGAFAISNYVELNEIYARLTLENQYMMVQEVNEQYIQSQLGATEMIVEYIQEEIKA